MAFFNIKIPKFSKRKVAFYCLIWGPLCYFFAAGAFFTYQIVYPHYVWAVNQRFYVIDSRYQVVLTSPVSAQEK